MENKLPEGTKLTVHNNGGRNVLRVELPKGSPELNRIQKKQIKAMVRKRVKEEKKKAKIELIRLEKVNKNIEVL